MIDLVIVHPGAAHGIYGVLGDALVAVEPPLWCRLIAAYVRDRGFSVKIIDAEAEKISPYDVGLRVKGEKPRLVCLAVYGHQPSASTQQMDGAGKTAKAIKSFSPAIEIIMVGGHVSALPERTLFEEHVDYACVGEGPVTIVSLLEGRREDTIPGLVWRDLHQQEQIHINDSAPLLDVGDLNGRAWDLLPMTKYRAHNWQCFGDIGRRQPYASIYTSLGCPYKCSFCCINAPFQSNRYRMRDPIDVVSEMIMLFQNYGVRTFKIIDEMFILNERHYKAIAEQLVIRTDGRSKHEFNIWAYARVDTVQPDTLALLRQAGFRWLALGIESGSKYVRDGAQKRLKNEDIKGVVRAIQAADINVIGNYIFGLPDDDNLTMLETLELALELNTEFANFYSAMAYPGSPLYTEAVKKGWKLPDSWRGYSQHNEDCRPLDTQYVSGADVLRFRDLSFLSYFTNGRYLDMVARKFGTETLAHVKNMTTYQLKRKLLEAA